MASWGDVLDFCEVMHLAMDPWEKETLVALANLRATIQSEQAQKPKTDD